jgi:hypothetical protein
VEEQHVAPGAHRQRGDLGDERLVLADVQRARAHGEQLGDPAVLYTVEEGGLARQGRAVLHEHDLARLAPQEAKPIFVDRLG